VAWGNLRVGIADKVWRIRGWCVGQKLVCACYSPYRLTTTTGAAVPFRFRRTENRAGDPYRNRPELVRNAARNRAGSGSEPAVRTDPNRNRFGFGLGSVQTLLERWRLRHPLATPINRGFPRPGARQPL